MFSLVYLPYLMLIVVSGDRDKLCRLGLNKVSFYLRKETESSIRKVVFNKKTGGWMMSKRSIIVLIKEKPGGPMALTTAR
jgi:hypothetical protein